MGQIPLLLLGLCPKFLSREMGPNSPTGLLILKGLRAKDEKGRKDEYHQHCESKESKSRQ